MYLGRLAWPSSNNIRRIKHIGKWKLSIKVATVSWLSSTNWETFSSMNSLHKIWGQSSAAYSRHN